MIIPGDPRKKAPKKWQRWTLYAIGLSMLILLGWDVVVSANPWRADTVSEITLWASLRSLTLPFVLGYLAGHLTWPAKKRNPIWLSLAFNGTFLAVLLTLDTLGWCRVLDLNIVREYPPLAFLPAYILGHFCWPQVRS